MKAWLAHHAHSLKIAIERFQAAPMATVLTVLVVGVTIALPAGLYVLLGNIKQATGGASPQAEISLFLKMGVTESAARHTAGEIGQMPEVATARFVSRDEALKRLQAGGQGELTAGLPENPLPHAVVVSARTASPEALAALAERLERLPGADHANLDSDWARRLAAILRLGEDIVWMLAAVLGAALAAITGNTIRLQIYAQRDEIEVARLIGATDRFIRRPFLYYGGLQGLAGGMVAWLMLAAALSGLQGSVSALAGAYGSQFQLAGLGWIEGGLMLAAAGLLGLTGAFFAVAHTRRALGIA